MKSLVETATACFLLAHSSGCLGAFSTDAVASLATDQSRAVAKAALVQ